MVYSSSDTPLVTTINMAAVWTQSGIDVYRASVYLLWVEHSGAFSGQACGEADCKPALEGRLHINKRMNN